MIIKTVKASLFEKNSPQKAFIHYKNFFIKNANLSSSKTFIKKVKSRWLWL